MSDTYCPRAHRLSINGRAFDIVVHDNETLLSVLRYKLDLIGTKQGCDKGDCGACTVLINGQPILSCISLARSYEPEDSITTIENFGSAHQTDIVLNAFEKSGALQCGFCQPGMILSAKALLDSNAQPTLYEIKQALSGNLCRCTGYTKIYLATLAASLVITKQASDVDEALTMLRTSRAYLGDA